MSIGLFGRKAYKKDPRRFGSPVTVEAIRSAEPRTSAKDPSRKTLDFPVINLAGHHVGVLHVHFSDFHSASSEGWATGDTFEFVKEVNKELTRMGLALATSNAIRTSIDRAVARPLSRTWRKLGLYCNE